MKATRESSTGTANIAGLAGTISLATICKRWNSHGLLFIFYHDYLKQKKSETNDVSIVDCILASRCIISRKNTLKRLSFVKEGQWQF